MSFYIVIGIAPFQGLREQVLQGQYAIPYQLSNRKNTISLLLTVNARQRPTVHDLMDLAWLQKGTKALRSHWDERPAVQTLKLWQPWKILGLIPRQKKLIHKKFNEITYLGARHQNNGCKSQAKPRNPGVASFPFAEDPATFPLPNLRRRVSEPSLRHLSHPMKTIIQKKGGRWYPSPARDRRRHLLLAEPTSASWPPPPVLLLIRKH